MLIVLYEPEIPPNTGNIARLCAAFGIELHLIEPLGFRLEDRYLRRAGLDYWPNVRLFVWQCFADFINRPYAMPDERLVMATTKANISLQHFKFYPADALVFGPETRGLPADLLERFSNHVRIPSKRMENSGVRSLNLSTACGIFLYAALENTGLIENYT